jgi:hypothetical protein
MAKINLMELVETIKNASEDEKKALAEVLKGLLPATQAKVSAVRDSGKYVRTDKKVETRLAQQMEILLKALPEDKPMTVAEWTEAAIAVGLQTQQDPARITMYYKKRLIEAGYVKAA